MGLFSGRDFSRGERGCWLDFQDFGGFDLDILPPSNRTNSGLIWTLGTHFLLWNWCFGHSGYGGRGDLVLCLSSLGVAMGERD